MSTKNLSSLLPILSCLVAATLWGLLWYPMRLLEAQGIPGLWGSLLIYIAALLPLLPRMFVHLEGFSRQPGLLFMVALTAGWANLGFILAVLEGTIVRVLLLFYLSPIWSVLLGWVVLKERPSPAALFSIVLALTGAFVILWLPDEPNPWSIDRADVLAITAGFAFSVMNICIRKLGDIPMILKLIPAFLGVILLSGIGVLVLQPVPPEFNAVSLMLVLATGSIGMLVMTYTAQYGVTHLPVHRSAVLFLFEIVAGAVSAILLTDEITTIREWLGGGMVIVATWITAHEAMNDRRSRTSQSKSIVT